MNCTVYLPMCCWQVPTRWLSHTKRRQRSPVLRALGIAHVRKHRVRMAAILLVLDIVSPVSGRQSRCFTIRTEVGGKSKHLHIIQ